MIDLEEVRALAVARCFDVLEFEPEAVAAHVLAGRFDPIAVLDALERIEEGKTVRCLHHPDRQFPIPPNRKPNSHGGQSAHGAKSRTGGLKTNPSEVTCDRSQRPSF